MVQIIFSYLPAKEGLSEEHKSRYGRIIEYVLGISDKLLSSKEYERKVSPNSNPLDVSDLTKPFLYIPIICNDGLINFESFKFNREVDIPQRDRNLKGILLLAQKPELIAKRKVFKESLEKLCQDTSTQFGLVEFIGPEDLIPKFRPELLKYS